MAAVGVSEISSEANGLPFSNTAPETKLEGDAMEERGTVNEMDVYDYPDGGLRAWLVVFGVGLLSDK